MVARFIEPGYNAGISSGYAEVEMEIAICDTADLKKPVCKIRMEKEKGGKEQFDTGVRIGEAYARAGKDVGKLGEKES